MSWLSDHAETMVSLVVGALLGIAGNWYFWRLGDKRKQLDWTYLGTAPIVRLNEQDSDSLPLEVRFNSELVDRPNVVRLRIRNTGTAPITFSDFANPIEVEFQDAVYLRADIVASNPESIQQKVEFEQPRSNSYRFTLNLLDKGEWLELRFITDGDTRPPEVSARVAGSTPPRRVPLQGKKTPPAFLAGVGVVTLGLVAYFIWLSGFATSETGRAWLLIIAGACTSMAIASFTGAIFGRSLLKAQERALDNPAPGDESPF